MALEELKKNKRKTGTFRQKKAVEIAKGLIATNQPVIMKNVMEKAGYSIHSVNQPKVLTESYTWKQAFDNINWGRQLQQLEELSDVRLNPDKDNVLRAKHMLFTVGDKYPKGQTKIVGIFNKIDSLQEDDFAK